MKYKQSKVKTRKNRNRKLTKNKNKKKLKSQREYGEDIRDTRNENINMSIQNKNNDHNRIKNNVECY